MGRNITLLKKGILGGGVSISPPSAPTGLTATPASTSQINLAWTDASSDETAFRVYRSTDGSTYSQVGTDLAAGATSYNDTTVDDGVYYYYKVAAVNTGGETLSAAATANTLTLNLTSYWNLNESSGGTIRVDRADSVGGMTLTDTNTTASTTGVVSNGGAFVTADQTYLTHADNAVLQMGDIDFTIAFWCNPSSTTGYPCLVSKDDSSGTRDYAVIIGYPTANKFGFQVAIAAGTKNVANTTAISTGNWYFVVAWHDKTADKIYLQVNNGTAAELATTGALASPSSNAFNIGTLKTTTGNFNGTIDEVGIWKRLLTADERTALYNGGAGKTYPFDGTASPVPVFAVGDSITVGVGDELYDGGYYNHLLASITGGADTCPRYAVSGYTAHDVQAGIDAILAARSVTPSYVIIYLGANEVVTMPSEADYKSDMNYILDAIHSKWTNAPIYVGTGSRPGGTTNYNSLVTWNAACLAGRAYCHAGVSYGDVFAGNEATRISGDNIHPNHAGHAAFAAAWKTALGL